MTTITPQIRERVFSTLLPKPQHCYLAFGEPVDVPGVQHIITFKLED